jgi:phage baseplate assembly protein W
MEALAFPFRFKRGRAATLDTADEAYYAQKVASVVSTGVGELPLRPLFGTSEPEFQTFDSSGLVYTCASNFPDIVINEILQSITADGRLVVDVQFDILSEGTANALT